MMMMVIDHDGRWKMQQETSFFFSGRLDDTILATEMPTLC